MKFGSDGHTQVQLDAVYIGRTYAGLLEGTPSTDYNDRILEGLRERAVERVGCGPFGDSGERIYGVRGEPCLIEPERRAVRRGEVLPGYYVFASLDGPETSEDFCGAMAIAVFFVDSLELPIEAMVERACANLSWRETSFNYDV